MKKLIIFFTVSAMTLFGQNNSASEPEIVDSVDLKRYQGVWYEIGKIPNKFQSHCVKNTTATYSIEEDGKIKVVNRCAEEDGEYDEADGVARIVDTVSNAKLEVSFVSFLGWRPFWGAYWIIGLDEDYQWAIVGHPERSYGWILSREKKLSKETNLEIFSILEEQGYNPSDFEMTIQE